MTNLNKFTKGMLLAASLTFASLSTVANANTVANSTANSAPSVSQMNTDLVAALQYAFSAQITAMADEIDREINAAIDSGLVELGLDPSQAGSADKQQKLDNSEEK